MVPPEMPLVYRKIRVYIGAARATPLASRASRRRFGRATWYQWDDPARGLIEAGQPGTGKLVELPLDLGGFGENRCRGGTGCQICGKRM